MKRLSEQCVEENGIICGQYIYIFNKKYKIVSYDVMSGEYVVNEVK